MTIKPSKSLEHSLYAGSVATAVLLMFIGFREPVALAMLLALIIFEVFRRLRGPQTMEEESGNATDMVTLNLSKK